MRPKVSVIIPVYQVERYLLKGLQSVQQQTLKDIEIICIDDGSQDNCATILDRIAEEDCRVRVIHNDNHGYGYSINCGFTASTGEYLNIFEPDDLLPSSALEKLYTLAREKKLDLVKGDYCQMREDSNGKHMMIPTRLHASDYLYDRVLTVEEAPGLLTTQIINCCGIFNRSVIEKNGVRLSETPGASYQDISLFFPLMLFSKSILFTHEKTYYYRIDNPNASTKNKGKLFMQEQEYMKAQELLKSISENSELMIASWSARWRGVLGTISRIDPILYHDFMNQIRPRVELAYNENLLQRKYCDAYQWYMLQRFRDGNESFFRALRNTNGKFRDFFRIGCRLRYDGPRRTFQFLKMKNQMRQYPLEH